MIVPMGFTPSGLPVGLEILGRPWSEPTLLKLASGFEAITQQPARSGEHSATRRRKHRLHDCTNDPPRLPGPSEEKRPKHLCRRAERGLHLLDACYVPEHTRRNVE